jgi:hypothetical protein
LALVSTIGFAAGGAAVLVGTILFVTGGAKKPKAAVEGTVSRLKIDAGPGGVSLQTGGTF